MKPSFALKARCLRDPQAAWRNLEFVLQQLAAFPARTMDVLVYFHIEDAPIPNGVAGNPEFVVVPVLYQPLNGTGMIEMEP